MEKFNHTITMTIAVIVICLVMGYATWLSFQKIAVVYHAEGLDTQGDSLSVLLCLRLVLILVLLVILALCVVLVMEHRYFRRTTKRLEMAVNCDLLTGASSRRYGSDCLGEAFREFAISGVSPAVMTFDLDHLKEINDSYGHEAGDQVLMRVVEVIYQNIGSTGQVIRWGGDEFVVLVQNVRPEDLGAYGARLVQVVSSIRLNQGEEIIMPSISLGASYFYPGDQSFAQALSRADQALYQAKKAGRNRAHVAAVGL